MLLVVSAFKGFAIAASDGQIGTVSDFLFDDEAWKIRWLVADTGTWLVGHKVLIHPWSVGHIDHARQEMPVALTMAQVKGSPSLHEDEPVSQQMESRLYEYYGMDSNLGGSYAGAMAMPLVAPPLFGASDIGEAVRPIADGKSGDEHLRSAGSVTGYHIHATDGDIGHIDDILFDESTWDIRYLSIDTRNWWPGQHVLVSPRTVQGIDWSDRHIKLNVTCDKVKSSPPWNSVAMIDQAYEERLESHYGWPRT